MELEATVAALEARQTTSEQRIKDLENEVHDMRELTQAVAVTNSKVDQLSENVAEMRTDIKTLNEAPKRKWDTLIASVVTAIAGTLVGALFALILK